MFDLPFSEILRKEETRIHKSKSEHKRKLDHRAFKLSYRRLSHLFDEGTFEEIGAGVLNRATDFDLANNQIPGDGVTTGFGEVNGKMVFAYSQERVFKHNGNIPI